MKKTICVLCENGKGNRSCPLENNASICSACCVKQRGIPCGQCHYYVEAENYAIERFKSTGQHRFQLDMRYETEIDEILELAASKKLKKATARLEELSSLIPGSHLLHFALGTVAGMREDYQQALFHFNLSLEVFPYFPEAWHNKGESLAKLADISGMIKAYRMVKRLSNPGDEIFKLSAKRLDDTEKMLLKTSHQTLDEYIEGEKIFNGSFDLMYAGEPELALRGFKKVLASNPEHVQSYGNIGLCHAMLGEKDEAVVALKKALELNPKYLPAEHNLRRVSALKDGECLSPETLSEPIEFFKDKYLKKSKSKQIT